MPVWNADDLDSAPCGLLVFTDDSLISSVNGTLTRQLGYTAPQELIGKSFESILGIAGRIFYQTHFFPLIKMQGRAEEIFFILKTKDRTDVPMICTALRKEKDSNYTNHCAFFRAVERGKYEEQLLVARRKAEQALLENTDLIAARKALEEHSIQLDSKLNQLVQMNGELAQFSTIISHDLQESIRKIALFADKVSQENKDILTPEVIRDLTRVSKECIRLRQLIAKLEAFISLNAQLEELKEVDLEQIFRATLQRIEKDTSYRYSLQKADTLPVVQGNQAQLEALFYHLLFNSAQYRDPNRDLVINIRTTLIQQNSYKVTKGKYRYADYVQIILTDNGTGFDARSNKEIFSIKRKESEAILALGFGLALSKKIVDNHEGFIELKSFPGRGTEITLRLPVNNHTSVS